MNSNKIFIMCHQGLGDHILCSGIYREIAKNYSKCVIPVVQKYSRSIRQMLRDVPNIEIISYRTELWNLRMLAHRNYFIQRGYDVLNLGTYGLGFFENEKKKLDQNFYDQADLPLDKKWSSFNYVRNPEKEKDLFNLLGCNQGDYIFLHDDPARNFNIDIRKIESEFRIIRADNALARDFTIFDYFLVLENASELHCIESSFSALIENCLMGVPKFAHRYARPAVILDERHHITFKSKWNIVT
jgi:hypothetical protein